MFVRFTDKWWIEKCWYVISGENNPTPPMHPREKNKNKKNKKSMFSHVNSKFNYVFYDWSEY
jgi:hypothetical protein